MYTMDTVLSAAIAEDYIDYIRIAKEELESGKKEVSLLILRCAQQMIMTYLEEMRTTDTHSNQLTLH